MRICPTYNSAPYKRVFSAPGMFPWGRVPLRCVAVATAAVAAVRTSLGRVRDMFGCPKGRTELIIGGPGAKNCAEHHGNVRFGVAPQKPTKIAKNLYNAKFALQYKFLEMLVGF